MREFPSRAGVLVSVTLAVAACGNDAERAAPSTSTSPAQISERGGEGEVSLHLDWPDGARADVESSRSVRRGAGQGTRADARWTFAVARRGARTEIRTGALVLRPPRSEVPEEVLHGTIVAVTFFPSARWGRDIDELELVDPESTARVLEGAVNAATSEALRASPSWASISQLFSGDEEMLTRQASSNLRPITSLDGLTLHPSRSVSTRESRPTVAGITAEQTTTTRLLGVGPCFEGDADDGCVSVEILASYDARSLAGALGDQGAIRSMEGSLRLVVEPDTLLPHRITAEKTTVFVVPVDDAPVEMTEVETLRWAFHYEPQTIRREGP